MSCSELKKLLVEKGFMPPPKRGRPAIYATDEERKAAVKEQKRVCSKRYIERIREAAMKVLEQASSVEQSSSVEQKPPVTINGAALGSK
jgi:hypothetical protein